MKYGEIIELIRNGTKRAARQGWNGKNMWIYIEAGKTFSHANLYGHMKQWLDGDMVTYPHFNMKAADGKIVVGWLASQTDMLADDWVILDP